MAWMKVETAVARNRKFIQAGPGPSWLWLCGLAYCQEGLTDGFIPTEALCHLGVKAAPALVKRLVSAGLWEITPGGWRIHDYLQHNKSAEEVTAIRRDRAAGGVKGGRPPKPSTKPYTQTLKVSENNLTPKPYPKPSLSVAVAGAVAVDVVEGGSGGEFPGDVWWAALLADYPKQRVTNNHLANQAFITALVSAKDGPYAAWNRMSANLANQKRGHEWRVKGMVPSLQKWLETGAWEQVHDEIPASATVTDRTAGTLSAAAAVKRMVR